MHYYCYNAIAMLLEQSPLPSLSLLHKNSSGMIDAVKCAQTLRSECKISIDQHLTLDEMYLQKCEEYFAGDLVGCNREGELCKGLVCFKIVGLKNSIPYVIKLSPKTKFNAGCLKEELVGVFSQSGFSVRAIVCDNHPSNCWSFKNLLQHFNQDFDELFRWYELRKIDLFYISISQLSSGNINY